METTRKHEEYHIRRLEQQMLDALLRIEELLLADRGDHGPAGGDLEGLITNVAPTDTPFSNKAGGITKVKRR